MYGTFLARSFASKAHGGAKEHGEVGIPRAPRLRGRHDLLHDPLGFFLLVAQDLEEDRVARAELRAQRFVMARRVVADDRVRRIEDLARGAVIPLEPHHDGAWEVLLELEDLPDVGAAPAVDRLVVVAHHAEIPGAGDAARNRPAGDGS